MKNKTLESQEKKNTLKQRHLVWKRALIFLHELLQFKIEDPFHVMRKCNLLMLKKRGFKNSNYKYQIYQSDKTRNLQPYEVSKWVQLSRLDGGDHIIGNVTREESHLLIVICCL